MIDAFRWPKTGWQPMASHAAPLGATDGSSATVPVNNAPTGVTRPVDDVDHARPARPVTRLRSPSATRRRSTRRPVPDHRSPRCARRILSSASTSGNASDRSNVDGWDRPPTTRMVRGLLDRGRHQCGARDRKRPASFPRQHGGRGEGCDGGSRVSSSCVCVLGHVPTSSTVTQEFVNRRANQRQERQVRQAV